jgi:uncharacterized protein YbbC (DUF1343 family)
MKIVVLVFLMASISFGQQKPVKVGADKLFESRFDLVNGKKVGLVTNHTAVLSNGKHLADMLYERTDVQLTVLFGPEHGVRGDAPDGRTIVDAVDEKTGVPIYSLYGKINKPTPKMLEGVDLLIFDIQDVGARFYTYISTMFLCMEAAAENKIPFIVLDRPNPITGTRIEGPIRVDSLKTFVGWVPIPIAHGMTVGELATMAVTEGWFPGSSNINLIVVKAENWKRSQWYDETSLQWIKPSPNMSSLHTAILYPGLCLIEGVNVSEGRGTEKPFEYIGAPWIDGNRLAQKLNAMKMKGVTFEPVSFTPQEIPNVASRPKYNGIQCGGIYIKVTDREVFAPVSAGIAVVASIHALHPDSLVFRERGFDRLAGTPVIRESILAGKGVTEIESLWQNELNRFKERRKKSLLY